MKTLEDVMLAKLRRCDFAVAFLHETWLGHHESQESFRSELRDTLLLIAKAHDLDLTERK